MPCFDLRFTSQYGSHSASKWADSAAEALQLERARHKGQRRLPGPVVYQTPTLTIPQPFTEESLAACCLRYRTADAGAQESVPLVEIHFDAPEEPVELTSEHEIEE